MLFTFLDSWLFSNHENMATRKICLLLLFIGMASFTWANPPRFSKDLRTLTTWMQGDFDNSAQVKRDTTVAFAEAHVVRIWENLYTEAIWLYEEINDKSGKPISQRIYRFSDGQKDVFEAIIYELKDMERYAGEYKQARPFEDFDPEADLTALAECTIYFRKKGDTKYSGSTIGKECAYKKGARARYVLSQIEVYEAKLVRADRGIGFDDEIVWGPSKESKGYEFKRPVVKLEKPKPEPKAKAASKTKPERAKSRKEK